MNVYRFECVVWVRGETLEEAQKELHDEVKYYFSQDNNLIARESDAGKLDEEGVAEMSPLFFISEITYTGSIVW